MTDNNPSSMSKSSGETLREARIALDLTLESVSSDTNLSVSVISSLENNSFENLPPFPYVKAFAMTLCQRLGINKESLIKILDEEMNIKPEQTGPESLTESVNLSKPSRNMVPLIILMTFGLVLLVVLMKIQ